MKTKASKTRRRRNKKEKKESASNMDVSLDYVHNIFVSRVAREITVPHSYKMAGLHVDNLVQ